MKISFVTILSLFFLCGNIDLQAHILEELDTPIDEIRKTHSLSLLVTSTYDGDLNLMYDITGNTAQYNISYEYFGLAIQNLKSLGNRKDSVIGPVKSARAHLVHYAHNLIVGGKGLQKNVGEGVDLLKWLFERDVIIVHDYPHYQTAFDEFEPNLNSSLKDQLIAALKKEEEKRNRKRG